MASQLNWGGGGGYGRVGLGYSWWGISLCEIEKPIFDPSDILYLVKNGFVQAVCFLNEKFTLFLFIKKIFKHVLKNPETMLSSWT